MSAGVGWVAVGRRGCGRREVLAGVGEGGVKWGVVD